MTTKEQERQALEKIRKICEGLGENSYVATAFDGAFEIAEQNIEWDAAFSVKGAIEQAQNESRQLGELYRGERERAQGAVDAARKVAEENEALRDKLQKQQEAAVEATIEARASRGEVEQCNDKLQELRLEIMQLKARLYDLLHGEE